MKNLKKHKCELCPKKYQSRKKLKSHFLKIHGLDLDKYEEEKKRVVGYYSRISNFQGMKRNY